MEVFPNYWVAFTYQGWLNTYSFSTFIFNFSTLLIKHEQMTATGCVCVFCGVFFCSFSSGGYKIKRYFSPGYLQFARMHEGRFLCASRGQKSGGESQQKPGSSKIKTGARGLYSGQGACQRVPGTHRVKGKNLSFNLEFPGFCHCVLPIVGAGPKLR